MFRFEHIEFFWALLMLPLFVMLFLSAAAWRKRALKGFADHQLLRDLIPDQSSGKPITRFVLFTLAYIFLVIGLANPQIGSKLEEVKREGVDLMIALDVSNSMKAEDLSPNRLERAKRAIEQLLDQVTNDRIGVVVFAGDAFVQLPITTDYQAAKLFLSSISTNSIPTQGTNIGNAIELSLESFDFEDKTSKAIVVITDGENHEPNAIEAAEAAAEKGVIVHTIGMGSAQGAPIPVYTSRGQSAGFAKDKQGNTVVTQLNEKMLVDLASAGNGSYQRATNASSGLDKIFNEIEKMEKVEFGSKVYTDYEDRFQYFIGVAIFFLLLELLISDRKNKLLGQLFAVKKSAKNE